MREALEMDITIFGKDNPTVAVDLSNLAVVLQQKVFRCEKNDVGNI